MLRTAGGDASISAGSLALDLRGSWVAVAETHGEAALAEGSDASIVLAREDGTEDVYVGKVRKSAFDDGALRVSTTVVGAAGLATALGPRDHAAGSTEVPAGLVARTICDEAGEVLEDGVEAALDLLYVPHWSRLAGSASAALDLLAEVLGLGWRVLASGRVWVGAETYPAGPEAPMDTGYELDDGGVRYVADGAQLLPGTTVGGRQLARVVYYLGGPLRCEARAAVSGDPARTVDRSLYARAWPATVVSQDASSGLLELQPDDERLGSADAALRGVPLRVGIPGCRVMVPVGARVRVAFDGADPRYPYAVALDQATAAAATKALALVSDAVTCGALSGVANLGTGVVTFTFTPPVGAPSVGPSVDIAGAITGLGHKYAKGVPA